MLLSVLGLHNSPWASQSTVLYIIHTVLPYPSFSGGTEKERIGGQAPLGEQESYCTARESRGAGWDASVGSGRARFTSRLCCQSSGRPDQSGQNG